jgi:hypothetical protein
MLSNEVLGFITFRKKWESMKTVAHTCSSNWILMQFQQQQATLPAAAAAAAANGVQQLDQVNPA